MPKRSAEYMAAQRDRILEAAIDCFIERGFQATSTDDIARAAGCGKSVLYAHFGSKRDIVRAVQEGGPDRYPELANITLAELPAFLAGSWAGLRSDRSRRMIRYSFRLAVESLDDAALADAQKVTGERYLAWVEAAIKRDPAGQALNPRQVRDAARRLVYYTSGMVMYELFYPSLGHASQRRDLEVAAAMAIASVKTPPVSRRARPPAADGTAAPSRRVRGVAKSRKRS